MMERILIPRTKHHLNFGDAFSICVVFAIVIDSALNGRWLVALAASLLCINPIARRHFAARRSITEIRVEDDSITVVRANARMISMTRNEIESVDETRDDITILFRRNEELMDFRFQSRGFAPDTWEHIEAALSAWTRERRNLSPV